MRTLDELVTAFTAYHAEYVWEDEKLTPRLCAPLLDVLDELKTSSGGRGSARGRRGDGSPRPEPLDLEREMREQLQGDYISLTIPQGRIRYLDLKPLVAAWRDEVRASDRVAAEIAAWQEQLEEWATDIFEMYSPPTQKEIMEACSICGQYRVTSMRDGEPVEMQALALTYREGSLEDTAVFACAKCGPLAYGMAAVRLAAGSGRHAL